MQKKSSLLGLSVEGIECCGGIDKAKGWELVCGVITRGFGIGIVKRKGSRG